MERERERGERHNNYTSSFHNPEVVMPPLQFQGEFTKINIWLQMFKHTSKRLPNTHAHKQEIPYAQAQKQKTSKQTQLQRKMIEVEHLIYNQWCSQYKSDTDS